MLLATSDDLPGTAIDAPLLLRAAGPGQRRRGDGGADGDRPLPATPPRVSIGEPQWWDVRRAYADEGTNVPATLAQLLDDSGFFLVRFACSLRVDDDSEVEWARFAVGLATVNPDAGHAIAFDLHPVELFDKVERNVHIRVAPTLKFAEAAEAGIGEVAFDIKYNELVPVITAAGAQEAQFDWHLRRTREHPLRGVRWFHAVLRVPSNAGGVEAELNLTAEIATPQGFFRGVLRGREEQPLTRVLCR